MLSAICVIIILCILDYELVNFKECYVGSSCPTSKCPKCHDDKDDTFRRMEPNQFATELWALKKKMKGRRHTPEMMKLHKLLRAIAVTKAIKKTKLIPNEMKKNTKKLNTIKTKVKTKSSLFARILKKETVFIDGKLMMKIVKGNTIANQ